MLIKEIRTKNKTHYNVLILAGVHGDELTPVYTAMQLYDKLCSMDPTKIMASEVTIVNMINETGIKHNCRDYVPDNVNKGFDLNRQLSKKKETFSDVISTLQSFVENNKYTVVIDIHSSKNINPCYLIDVDKNYHFMYEYLSRLHLPIAARYCKNDTIKKFSFSDSPKRIGLTLELDGMDINFERFDEYIDLILPIINNDPNQIKSVDKNRQIKILEPCISHTTGFTYIYKDRLNKNRLAGSPFGCVIDLNNEKYEYYMPINGRIIEFSHGQYIEAGQQFVSIQPL